MSDYSQYLDFTRELAFESGKVLNNHFGNIDLIDKKSTSIDLVTKADLDSEQTLIQAIQKKYPSHSIITEESDLKEKNSDFRWVIDPLDGTTNFVHNLPIFAISIGLQYKQKTILGVVYNPAADKMFYASINNGAYLNEKPINVSLSNTLSDSLIVTGFPYLQDERWELSFDIFKTIYSKTRGIRRLGAAALDLCFVAMGRFEGFYEFNLKPWDICAGSIIAKEAGALVTDWNNKELPFSGERILAGNKKIHEELTNILSDHKFKLFYN
tara:strand:+ start:634 stop:1440 length:807 start_codon:yes stop_codon:yes gene_type:complete